MLTSAYYYDVYRPFIYSRSDRAATVAKKARIADKAQQQSKNKVVILNKSHKTEIVQHARGVTQSLVGFTGGLRRLMKNMDDYTRTEQQTGDSAYTFAARSRLTGGLDRFAETYTQNAAFMRTQSHSDTLRTFAEDLGDKVYENLVPMGRMGFRMSTEGALRFNAEAYERIPTAAFGRHVVACRRSLRELYTFAQSMLTEPLSQHMHFKALSYHYNYHLGHMVEEGFGIIDSGILLDRVL